jgi:hypothetical protein
MSNGYAKVKSNATASAQGLWLADQGVIDVITAVSVGRRVAPIGNSCTHGGWYKDSDQRQHDGACQAGS